MLGRKDHTIAPTEIEDALSALELLVVAMFIRIEEKDTEGRILVARVFEDCVTATEQAAPDDRQVPQPSLKAIHRHLLRLEAAVRDN
ncbi:hypothetical protein [Pararhizobium haloflavum]|uniref:hypothetical protein n=1 Tax=Pararhizobium haloflavum TaxID=2037914 RepID=UPI000C19D7FA|nr:hypothetical protein [Pararhizobium haloflavum]